MYVRATYALHKATSNGKTRGAVAKEGINLCCCSTALAVDR
jgi:hypothetical protein